ncbi:MAG: hypothetical protein CMJ25_20455 [Phycisphaerae bacterium]|nr:hypothetical protein [Phycisphaerae bacterium]
MAITARTSFQAAPLQQTLSDNYLDIQTNGWAQQYLPDLMEAEAEVYGKRTISGFLGQVGAEEAMSADQVIWSEQGRLHLSYRADCLDASASTINITHDIDGVARTTDHGIRVGDQVLISGGGQTVTALVTVAAAGNQTITALPYGGAHLSDMNFADGDNDLRVLVFGSEHSKGTAYNGGRANKPNFTSFTNKPIILKDYYEVSGSDASQIGWVEVSGEDGQAGYLWYLKAEGETRSRFMDYTEMSMIESEKAADSSTILGGANGLVGTEGLFAAIKSRGHQSSGVTGVNAATDLAEFDAILAEFDKNGAIEENMLFVNRATSLAIDDMLASMNSYGAGGTSYGVFDNSEDMALNLGFSGFRRGSYDFYKSDWKYLNDLATRGGINANATAGEDIRGVIIPAGVSSVYDEQLGKNLKRPFLHVRFRASQTESRKMKTWITGSVGAATSDLDAMQVNFLSERCLVTQGANNFMLLN